MYLSVVASYLGNDFIYRLQHLTETCEKESPHLITHVETTTAPVSDDARTAIIHERLKQKELEPGQHMVDTGYVDAQLLHRSQEDYGIDLVGPTRPDVKGQAQQQTGFDAGHFAIDWQAEQATCASWTHEHQLDARHRQPQK